MTEICFHSGSGIFTWNIPRKFDWNITLKFGWNIRRKFSSLSAGGYFAPNVLAAIFIHLCWLLFSSFSDADLQCFFTVPADKINGNVGSESEKMLFLYILVYSFVFGLIQ